MSEVDAIVPVLDFKIFFIYLPFKILRNLNLLVIIFTSHVIFCNFSFFHFIMDDYSGFILSSEISETNFTCVSMVFICSLLPLPFCCG